MGRWSMISCRTTGSTSWQYVSHAVKFDIAPKGYSVLHVHRQRLNSTGRLRAGGLALIYNNQLSAKHIECNFSSSLVSKSVTFSLKSQTFTAHLVNPKQTFYTSLLNYWQLSAVGSMRSSYFAEMLTCQVRTRLASTNGSASCSTFIACDAADTSQPSQLTWPGHHFIIIASSATCI